MKLQKSTLLALYSVLEFAADPGRQITAGEIAGKYGVSTHHLSKVLRDLGRAGLLESVRGVGGGYRFSGNTKRITLMDVIDLFEDISARTAKGGTKHNGNASTVITSERGSPKRANVLPAAARSRGGSLAS